MLRILLGIFIILHGLVHMWYVVLSFNWVAFQPDMGWTGASWILSPIIKSTVLKPVTGILFIFAALGFIVGGVGFLARATWNPKMLLISAIFSLAILILFWDGSFDRIIQKGLIGALINLGIIIWLIT